MTLNASCVTISGRRTEQLVIIASFLPRHWLHEWFSQFHSCGTYSVLSRSPSVKIECFRAVGAPCGFQGCKNKPAFISWSDVIKATKPGSVYLSFSIVFFYCFVVYNGHFLCNVTLFCYVFCLLVVLVKSLSVLAKWLSRKTPLREPNRGEGIISTKPRPKIVYDFLGLMYCFIVTLHAKLQRSVL